MATQHILKNTPAGGQRSWQCTHVASQSVCTARAFRYLATSLIICFELAVASVLVGASWTGRGTSVETGSYTRQGQTLPPSPTAGPAAWQRYERSLSLMRLAVAASAGGHAESTATPAAQSGVVPMPVPMPMPTPSVSGPQ